MYCIMCSLRALGLSSKQRPVFKRWRFLLGQSAWRKRISFLYVSSPPVLLASLLQSLGKSKKSLHCWVRSHLRTNEMPFCSFVTCSLKILPRASGTFLKGMVPLIPLNSLESLSPALFFITYPLTSWFLEFVSHKSMTSEKKMLGLGNHRFASFIFCQARTLNRTSSTITVISYKEGYFSIKKLRRIISE